MSVINTSVETFMFCGQEFECISTEAAKAEAENLAYSTTVDGAELAITTLVNVIEELPQEWTSSTNDGDKYHYQVEIGEIGYYATIFRTRVS